MSIPSETQVLIAGAGPACRMVDPLLEPPQYAKAVGVQPRTFEMSLAAQPEDGVAG